MTLKYSDALLSRTCVLGMMSESFPVASPFLTLGLLILQVKELFVVEDCLVFCRIFSGISFFYMSLVTIQNISRDGGMAQWIKHSLPKIED